MAGAYVGLGIILIFTLGNLVDPSIRPLVMGGTFGIALTLVIIAGSELYTGHTMFLTFGVKTGQITIADTLRVLPQTWAGNLIGSVGVALLFFYAGGGKLLPDTNSYLTMWLWLKHQVQPLLSCSKAFCVTGLSA